MARGSSIGGALAKWILVPALGLTVGYVSVTRLMSLTVADDKADAAQTPAKPAATTAGATPTTVSVPKTAETTPGDPTVDPDSPNAGPEVTIDAEPYKPAEVKPKRRRHKKPVVTPKPDDAIPRRDATDVPNPTESNSDGADKPPADDAKPPDDQPDPAGHPGLEN